MNMLFLILMAAVAGILAASLIVFTQWRREHGRAEALAVANGRLEERLRQTEEPDPGEVPVSDRAQPPTASIR